MMGYEQLFSWIDLPFIAILAVVELLLSADNAGALAYLVRSLPPHEKRKALYIGLLSALLFRAVSVAFAFYLILFFWMQILGGLYLIYLTVHHFSSPKEVPSHTSFWKTVYKVELMDILFAIDSILAAFGLAALYYSPEILPHKLWAIYLGGLLGLILMRFTTLQVIKWLETHPRLEKAILFLVGWVGLKLIVAGALHFVENKVVHHLVDLLFALGALAIMLVGFLSTKSSQRR